MNRRGNTQRDWVEFWWKAIIFSAIAIVLVVAIVNSYRERMSCPTSQEREYVEEVDATVIWFEATNTQLETLYAEAGDNPNLYTDSRWKASVKQQAGTLSLVSYDLSARFPVSERTEALQVYIDDFWAYTSAASEHILKGLETNDRGMLLEGNIYRTWAELAAREYIDATITLWPECSLPMAGSSNVPARANYGTR